MQPAEVQAFKDRIGIEKLTGADSKEGVRADWTSLPGVLPGHLRNMKYFPGEISSPERSLTNLTFDWKKHSASLSVWVFVSGIGPQQARDKLVSIASTTMMMTIPFQPGPLNLGDVSVEHTRGPSTKMIWAFRNVCVLVSNSGSGVPVEPVARAIQAFMKANLVPDIAPFVPRPDAVVISPKLIHVGDQVQVAVTLPKNVAAVDIFADINQGRERLLAEQHIQDLTAKYLAERPGRSRVDVSLVNRKTLLSPDLSVELQVLP